MEKFYRNLYQESPDIGPRKSFWHDIHTPKVNPLDKNNMNWVLDVEEIELAIEQLKRNKAPGCDGLPIEFYQKFSSKLVNILYYVYQETFNDKLNMSTRWGIIFLLEKQGKDLLLIKNWRTLSLLNCDYKILAKLI